MLHRRIPGCLVLLLIIAAPAGAMFMERQGVPLDRLLANVKQYIQKHPDDPESYYVLGRLHSLAFATDTDEWGVSEGKGADKLPVFPSYQSILSGRNKPGALSASAKEHFAQSLANYARAISMDAKQSRYQLGYAWMHEEGARYAADLGAPPGDKAPATRPSAEETAALKKQWEDKAVEAYTQAFALAFDADKAKQDVGPAADALISEEAAQRTIAILKPRGDLATEAEKKVLADMEAGLKAMQNKSRAVTPIIFPLDGPRPLSALVDDAATVGFDLSGESRPQRWSWVKPSAGILVWDPDHSGKITSGLQLFGSSTWWIAWSDGYRPLAFLDDDANGWLAGKELEGLAVWRDANGDGVCDSGEVTSVQSIGVMRMAVSAQQVDGIWQNPAGIELRDGRILPTYDWVARGK